MASRGNKLKIPSYIINIIQDKLGEIINILLIKNYGRSKVIFGTF